MPKWNGYVKVLFEDLKTHHTYAIYYFIFFCLRRFLFVAVAMIYFERPWIQAIMYWQVSFFALMLLFKGRPFKEKSTNYVEIFNEVIVLLIGYHLCVLTGFNIGTERRFTIGISIIILVSLLISVHIIRWLIGFIAEIKIKFMKHKLKKGLKLKLESTMKSIKKADEEIQENNQH